MGFLILMILLSPVIPLLYLFNKWEKNGKNLKYTIIMLVISLASNLIGSYLESRASGWNSLAYIGLINGGQFGLIISALLFVYSLAKSLR